MLGDVAAGAAHRARHRREQSVPRARRPRPRRAALRHAPVADRHALRPVHQARAGCAELCLLPGCAFHPGGDPLGDHTRARRGRAPVSRRAADRARPTRAHELRAGLCRRAGDPVALGLRGDPARGRRVGLFPAVDPADRTAPANDRPGPRRGGGCRRLLALRARTGCRIRDRLLRRGRPRGARRVSGRRRRHPASRASGDHLARPPAPRLAGGAGSRRKRCGRAAVGPPAPGCRTRHRWGLSPGDLVVARRGRRQRDRPARCRPLRPIRRHPRPLPRLRHRHRRNPRRRLPRLPNGIALRTTMRAGRLELFDGSTPSQHVRLSSQYPLRADLPTSRLALNVRTVSSIYARPSCPNSIIDLRSSLWRAMAPIAEFGVDQMHGIGIVRVIRSKVCTEHELLACFRQKLNCPIFRRFGADLISQYLPKVVADRRGLRVELDGETALADRLVPPALFAKSLAQIGVRYRQSRVELDGETVLADRLVLVALLVKDITEVVVRQGRFRVELYGETALAECLDPLALLVKDRAEIVVRQGRFRVELYGEAVLADRLVPLALFVKDLAEIGVRQGRFRVELDCETVLADRLVPLTLFVKYLAEIGVWRGRFRVELDGEAALTDRLVPLALFAKNLAEIGVRQGRFRVELDGETALADGLVLLALFVKKLAEIVVWHREFRVELNGETVLADRLLPLTLLVKNRAEVVVRRREFRVEPDGETVLANRLVPLARFVKDLSEIGVRRREFRGEPDGETVLADFLVQPIVLSRDQSLENVCPNYAFVRRRQRSNYLVSKRCCAHEVARCKQKGRRDVGLRLLNKLKCCSFDDRKSVV